MRRAAHTFIRARRFLHFLLSFFAVGAFAGFARPVFLPPIGLQTPFLNLLCPLHLDIQGLGKSRPAAHTGLMAVSHLQARLEVAKMLMLGLLRLFLGEIFLGRSTDSKRVNSSVCADSCCSILLTLSSKLLVPAGTGADEECGRAHASSSAEIWVSAAFELISWSFSPNSIGCFSISVTESRESSFFTVSMGSFTRNRSHIP